MFPGAMMEVVSMYTCILQFVLFILSYMEQHKCYCSRSSSTLPKIILLTFFFPVIFCDCCLFRALRISVLDKWSLDGLISKLLEFRWSFSVFPFVPFILNAAIAIVFCNVCFLYEKNPQISVFVAYSSAVFLNILKDCSSVVANPCRMKMCVSIYME